MRQVKDSRHGPVIDLTPHFGEGEHKVLGSLDLIIPKQGDTHQVTGLLLQTLQALAGHVIGGCQYSHGLGIGLSLAIVFCERGFSELEQGEKREPGKQCIECTTEHAPGAVKTLHLGVHPVHGAGALVGFSLELVLHGIKLSPRSITAHGDLLQTAEELFILQYCYVLNLLTHCPYLALKCRGPKPTPATSAHTHHRQEGPGPHERNIV